MFRNINKPLNGFALPAAIFVIVAISSMVLAMARLSVGQATGSVWTLLSTRAYWAAETGLEVGVKFVLDSNTCTGIPDGFAVGSYTIDMACTATIHTEDLVDLTRYKITATAQTTGMTVADSDFVYKQLEAVVIN